MTRAPADAFATALGAQLFPAPAAARHRPAPTALVVAYSGGRDSTVLLHLANAFARRHGVPLRAVHVNHQLQPAAMDFVRHCQQVCAALALPLQVITVEVARSHRGMEADARDARYAALAANLQPHELLLLGQHADDQIETFLLQLLRGAGPAGLAAMPATAECGPGRLLRPLLAVRRAALTELAQARGWHWLDDPSNADLALARNRLRTELMPVLLAQRDGAAEVLLRAIGWQADSAQLLAELAAIDAETAGYPNGLLSRQRLLQLSPARQANLLRGWLRRQAVPRPTAEQLSALLQQLPAPSDQVTLRWGDWQLRVAGDQLVCLPQWPAPDWPAMAWSIGASPRLSGPSSATLKLPVGLGELTWLPEGASTAASADMLAVRPPAPDEPVSLRWLTPGLRLALPGRRGRRELKDVFQEAGIPAWLRPYWPKLFYGESCVALPGLLVTEAGFAVNRDHDTLGRLVATGALFTLARQLRTPGVACC